MKSKLESDLISDPDHFGVLLGARTNIDPQVLCLDYLLSFGIVEQMNWFPSNDAVHRPRLRPDGHALPNELLWIPAADSLCVNETIVVDVRNDQSDLISMPSQHHTHRGVGVLAQDQIAMQICGHGIAEGFGVVSDDLLNGFFVAGNARRFDKRF